MDADIEKLANYTKVKVRDLKEFLETVSDDYTVIISKDGEGNQFSPMATGTGVGRWEPHNPYVGDFDFDDDNPTCVVLFPVS